MVLTLKSTPIVAACSASKASSVNLRRSDDFPTPLSPKNEDRDKTKKTFTFKAVHLNL